MSKRINPDPMVDQESGPARDLDRTRADILAVATAHFARSGFFGARIDEIAAETATTKRMIYYCFGSKDELYSACLHAEYAAIRAHEQALQLDDMAPAEAIDAYVRATVRYHESHPELAMLVRTENLRDAVHLDESDQLLNRSIVDTLDRVLARGQAAGEFRAQVSGIEVHVMVTALANYRITNYKTVNALFGFALRDPARLEHDLDQYVAMLLGWLRRSGVEATADQPASEVGVQ